MEANGNYLNFSNIQENKIVQSKRERPKPLTACNLTRSSKGKILDPKTKKTDTKLQKNKVKKTLKKVHKSIILIKFY